MGAAISATQLIAGPLLALGLFTRVAAVPLVIFLIVTNFERWRVGKYFWNQLGLEYTLMWTIAAIYFLVHGGGRVLARPAAAGLGVLSDYSAASRRLHQRRHHGAGVVFERTHRLGQRQIAEREAATR